MWEALLRVDCVRSLEDWLDHNTGYLVEAVGHSCLSQKDSISTRKKEKEEKRMVVWASNLVSAGRPFRWLFLPRLVCQAGDGQIADFVGATSDIRPAYKKNANRSSRVTI